jgi:hypothetical protein
MMLGQMITPEASAVVGFYKLEPIRELRSSEPPP